MTTVRKNLPFPDLFARGRGAVAHADTEWESVMVQITLAFVIILGYLVSKGISDSRDLAQRIAEQEQVNARLEQVVNDFCQVGDGTRTDTADRSPATAPDPKAAQPVAEEFAKNVASTNSCNSTAMRNWFSYLTTRSHCRSSRVSAN